MRVSGFASQQQTTSFQCAQPLKTSQYRVLVTGGTGLLGRPLIAELHRRGFVVTSVSSSHFQRLHPKVQELFESSSVQHLALDLAQDVESESHSIKRVIEEGQFDLVINLAGDRGGVRWDGEKRRMNSIKLNTNLPVALAEILAAQESVIPLIQLSTEYIWSGEATPPSGYPPVEIPSGGEPSEYKDIFVQSHGAPYAWQKRLAEEGLRRFERVIIVRTPVLYGQVLGALEDGTAGASIHNYLNDNDWSHDTWQKRYPTNAEDCGFVIAALASKLLKSGLEQRVYNYGAQAHVSKYHFMELFALATGLSTSDIKRADASTREASKRPPYDVKLNITSTREELERARDWREPGELSPLDFFEIWLPHFRQAVAAKRGPSYSPNEATNACLLKALVQRLGDGPRICLQGDSGSCDPCTEEAVKKVAGKLSAKLSNGAIVITDGRGGVQSTFALHYTQCTYSRLYNLLPVGESGGCHAGKDIHIGLDCQERGHFIKQLGDVYLAVGANAKAEDEMLAVSPRGATVFSLLLSEERGAAEAAQATLAVPAMRPAAALVHVAGDDEAAIARVAERAEAQANARRIIACFKRHDPEGTGCMHKRCFQQMLRHVVPSLAEGDIDILQKAFPALHDSVQYEDFVFWAFNL